MSEPVYYEPGRGFRSAYFFGALLVAGFLFDLSLGGAVTHLPGWIIAAVLVIGVDLLLIYAARSTHSLSLTKDELRVGDEAIACKEIVGVTPAADRSLPALGWPVGLPRGTKGVTVRLVDDRDVVVPTRFPRRLEAALHVGESSERDRPSPRVARDEDLPQLDEIDDRADTVFRVAGYDLPEITVPGDARADAKVIFVVGTPVVGFVRVDEVDGDAHIAELAVLPSSMRKGYGSDLLERACSWASEQRYPAVTLTTYAEVPWNGPYYARRGFAEVAAPSPGLVRIREREAALGLDAVARRIVMRRDLA